MAIIRWAPFDLASENLDDLVRRTFGDFGSSLLTNRSQLWSPPLDAFVEGEQLRVRMELPGVDPETDVDIEVENGVLHISGERKQEVADEGTGYFRREMHHGRFERRIALPDGIDAENVTADYQAGILDISIPLPAKAKTKVKVGIGNGNGNKQLES